MELFRIIRSECRDDGNIWLLVCANLTGIEDPNVFVAYVNPNLKPEGSQPPDAPIHGLFWCQIDKVVHDGFPTPTTTDEYLDAGCPI